MLFRIAFQGRIALFGNVFVIFGIFGILGGPPTVAKVLISMWIQITQLSNVKCVVGYPAWQLVPVIRWAPHPALDKRAWHHDAVKCTGRGGSRKGQALRV